MKESKISEERIKKLVDETVEKFIKENNPVVPLKKNVAPNPRGQEVATKPESPSVAQSEEQPVAKPKPSKSVVKFDSNTDTPYTVTFSERGFSIGGTRLSFETLHNAISKGYNIVLDQGQGLELTPVRMQQILKYEDKY